MKLTVDLGARSYDVVIKAGVLKKAGLLANLTGKVMLVTDGGVPAKYVKTLLAQCKEPVLVTLPQGEAGKSADAWRHILSRMLQARFTAHDTVAALGGGTVGDVAGFAAATYMRGVALCQFPTTTTAQAGSAVGGESALHWDGVRNAVGAFHQPAIVAADPSVLETLPPRHYASGLAEALKMGLLFSGDLFALLESGQAAEHIEKILYLSVLHKKSVVEQGETGKARRALLSFGYTIGHGLEAAAAPGGLLHGEAVALGMLPMIESKSLLRRTRAAMRRLGLPLTCGCDRQRALAYMQSDKRREGGAYTVARVKKLGEGYLETISEEELRLLVMESGAW